MALGDALRSGKCKSCGMHGLASDGLQDVGHKGKMMRNSKYTSVQIKMSDSDSQFCLGQPEGRSAFVRRLIDEDQADPSQSYDPPKRTTKVNSGYVSPNILLSADHLDYLATKPGGRGPYIRHLISAFRER